MELYIRVKNGQAFEHPILGDNFRQAFPNVDINNLPPNFARFERIAPPSVGVYEVYLGATYERNGDVFTDIHHIREMTPEEKTAKQQATKDAWVQGQNFASWTFDESSCSFVPPVPYPKDGKVHKWDEPTTSWVVVNNVA